MASVDQRLAELQLRKQQLAAREQKLQSERKSRDLRLRAKGERVILQLVLDRLAGKAEFKKALLLELAAATLKPEDRSAALWLLTEPDTKIDAATAGAISKPAASGKP